MGSDSFVHLHLHTSFSLLDGAVRIKEVMKKAVEHEMPAIAMTDHGNLFGAIDFYQAAKKAGVKPIIGCETYMAPGSMLEKKASSASEAAFHFTLLAKDETGYRNLVKLVSAAHLDGFYYKPRIDKELLAKHAQGLIGMSGCLKGEVNQAILGDQMDTARATVATFRDILGPENFFLELHNHGIEAQRKCNAHLPGLAREFGLGLVAANDVHFLERSHHEAHDVMICIGTGANVADEKRMRYVPELYFKSPREMRTLFADHPEALNNTLEIAGRCNLELEFGVPKYPNYTPPAGISQEDYLDQICERGVRERYGAESDSAVIRERLAREVGLLRKLGFVNYFLITWDFIRWAKEQDIPVGPGRGSAAGSMVAYVMGITDIDPIKFKLLFERFLNPERVSPPDIDVDFCMNGRSQVIDYVRGKYGERAVSQIITFGTLGAKSVVRDVGRVMGWSYGDADRVAKMIPNELNITLSGALEKNPDLKAAVENEPATRQLWEYSTVLEGLSRNSGVHAAGVVISDRDLSEYIPLSRSNDGSIVSQYSMSPLTDLGMLKMDFLGLKTLTVIQDAVNLVRAEKTPDFDIAKIPPADQEAFDVINRGETVALFQIESGGMVGVCKQFEVTDLEHINAIIALYRPGPMELIPEYIKRKKGLKRIKYAHPLLEQVCGDTYGIFVYQEQVMQAVQVMAGYSLGGADLLRRAMGKKDRDKMALEREKFVAGANQAHGISAEKAAEVFDLLEKFAGYGFNRSHSAAYAWICYQTAFLKAHYPVEFMAAVMSNEVRNTDKISIFVGECQRMGMTILPPDVNRSGLKFLPEVSGEAVGIRFGLAAVKNVGEAAMQAAIEEREAGGEFKSMEDFCRRVDTRKANKKVLEALVKCGAFDFTGTERAALFARIDSAIAAAAAAHRDRASGQVPLFGDMLEEESSQPETEIHVAPWPLSEKLLQEKELLGFYVTGHPLDEYAELMAAGSYTPIRDLPAREDKATVTLAGMIQILDKKFTKKDGKPFAILTLEDLTGSLEVMVWNETYSRHASALEKGNVVALTGRLDLRDEGVRLAASEITRIEIKRTAPKPLRLKLLCDQVTEKDLQSIRSAVLEYPGVAPLELWFVRPDGRRARLAAGRQFSVDFQPALRDRLAAWL